MFEAFFRAPNVGRRKGTGVGLYVTKRAVEMCEGAITFDTTHGKGTTFYVSMPLGSMP
jgi:signal transduction histidine kinase